MRKVVWCVIALIYFLPTVNAQITSSKSLSELSVAGEYEIGGIQITGSENLDRQVITLISGLRVGDKISLPGEETTRAIKKPLETKTL